MKNIQKSNKIYKIYNKIYKKYIKHNKNITKYKTKYINM